MSKRRSFVSLLSVCLAMSACATLGASETSRLDLINKRGELRCGVSGKIPGFSFLQRDGSYAGLDGIFAKPLQQHSSVTPARCSTDRSQLLNGSLL